MITKMRQAKDSVAIKLFLIITAICLLGWNIPHLMSVVTTPKYILKAGKTEVTEQDFQIVLSQVNLLTAQQQGLQRPLTQQELEQYNIINSVYMKEKINLLFAEAARSNGMVISTKAFAESIQRMPMFIDASLKFNRKYFENFLNILRITPDQYFSATKNELLANQLITPLVSEKSLPDSFFALANASRKQQYDFEYIELHPEPYNSIATPNDEVLSSWFDGVKDQFLTPEYRKVSYFLTDNKDQELYTKINNARADGLTIPDLAQSYNFELHSALLDNEGKDTNNKPLNVPQIKNLVKAAFDIDENSLYLPTAINLGSKTLWLQLDEIVPATPKKFEDIKAEVTTLWKKQRSLENFFNNLQNLSKQAEESGSIEKFANKINKPVKYLKDVSLSNLSKSRTDTISDNDLAGFINIPMNKPLLVNSSKPDTAIIVSKVATREGENNKANDLTEQQKKMIQLGVKDSILRAVLNQLAGKYPMKERVTFE